MGKRRERERDWRGEWKKEGEKNEVLVGLFLGVEVGRERGKDGDDPRGFCLRLSSCKEMLGIIHSYSYSYWRQYARYHRYYPLFSCL